MTTNDTTNTGACRVMAQGDQIIIDGLTSGSLKLSVADARHLAVQLQIALISAMMEQPPSYASLPDSGTPAIAFISTGPPFTGNPRGHRAAISRDLAMRVMQTQLD